MGRMLTTKQAAEYLGLTPQTVSTYAYLGRIESQGKNELGWRTYDTDYLDEYKKKLRPKPSKNHTGNTTTARSTYRVYYVCAVDDNDLTDQEAQLISRYESADLIIKDKGDPSNDERNGINQLIDLSVSHKITDLYVVNQDVLATTGYHYLEKLLSMNGVSIHFLETTVE